MLEKFVQSIRRALAGLVCVAAVSAAVPAAAAPALWAIRDADSTIYLFGTVHMLRPQTQWRSAKLDAALKGSDELVLEIVGGDDPAVMQPLMLRYGLDRTTPLSKKLTAKEWAKAKGYAERMGVPAPAFDAMRPWLASITLAMAPMIRAGFDPQKGVEQVLTAEIKAAGGKLNALETPEQQLRFFADLPVADEVALLRATLKDVDDTPAKLDKLVDAWAGGDLKALKAEFVTQMKTDYAPLYKTLIVNRNAAWADELKAKLNGKGVSFVAVGAGHLVGPDSVQALLAKRGVRVERLQ